MIFHNRPFIDVAIVLKGQASRAHAMRVAVEFDGPNHFTRQGRPLEQRLLMMSASSSCVDDVRTTVKEEEVQASSRWDHWIVSAFRVGLPSFRGFLRLVILTLNPRLYIEDHS